MRLNTKPTKNGLTTDGKKFPTEQDIPKSSGRIGDSDSPINP